MLYQFLSYRNIRVVWFSHFNCIETVRATFSPTVSKYTIKLTKVRRVEQNAYDCGIFARTMIHIVHDFPLHRQGLGGNRWFTLYGVSDGDRLAQISLVCWIQLCDTRQAYHAFILQCTYYRWGRIYVIQAIAD